MCVCYFYRNILWLFELIIHFLKANKGPKLRRKDVTCQRLWVTSQQLFKESSLCSYLGRDKHSCSTYWRMYVHFIPATVCWRTAVYHPVQPCFQIQSMSLGFVFCAETNLFSRLYSQLSLQQAGGSAVTPGEIKWQEAWNLDSVFFKSDLYDYHDPVTEYVQKTCRTYLPTTQSLISVGKLTNLCSFDVKQLKLWLFSNINLCLENNKRYCKQLLTKREAKTYKQTLKAASLHFIQMKARHTQTHGEHVSHISTSSSAETVWNISVGRSDDESRCRDLSFVFRYSNSIPQSYSLYHRNMVRCPLRLEAAHIKTWFLHQMLQTTEGICVASHEERQSTHKNIINNRGKYFRSTQSDKTG